jgi:hypothetical protein
MKPGLRLAHTQDTEAFMKKKTWLLIPLVAVAVWHGPARLARWALARPASEKAVEANQDRDDHDDEDARSVTVERAQVLAPGATCELENQSGEIEVRPSADRTARLRAVLSAESVAALQRSRVEVSSDDKGLRARAVVPRRGDDVEVRYTLELPAGVALRLRTVSGDVEVRGAQAAVEVQAVSGEVHLRDLGKGLRLNTVSGDVELDGVAGPLTVRTVSGDIEGRLARGSEGGEIHTVSGEVSLRAPRAAGLGVRAGTLSGEVQSDFGTEGAHVLSVHTTSGDISVHAE